MYLRSSGQKYMYHKPKLTKPVAKPKIHDTAQYPRHIVSVDNLSIGQFSLQSKPNLLMIGSHFPHHHVHKLLRLIPEFLVHCQVDEEVADVVDVIKVEKNLPRQFVVNSKEQRYEADDVDGCDENKLRHCHHVTSVVGSRSACANISNKNLSC